MATNNTAVKVPRVSVEALLGLGDKARLLYLFLLSRVDDYGETETSLRQLAKALRLSPEAVRYNMKRLIDAGLATQTATRFATRITLCGTATKRKPTTQPATQAATHARRQFVPPTVAEAQAYIDEMKFHWGTAERFIDFYETRGWELSRGTPMRDWKAAMRNWENRWKEKYTTSNGRDERYAKRRGADSAAVTAEDYTAAI